MKFNEQKALEHIQQVEEKANEILTDRQEVIALDKRRNNDRVGMRALQKENCEKIWLTIGPLLVKMPSKIAEELLVKGIFINIINQVYQYIFLSILLIMFKLSNNYIFNYITDQRECDTEINKIRSNLKVKVNELRDLEFNAPVPGLMLQPMSYQEMSAIKQILGQNS